MSPVQSREGCAHRWKLATPDGRSTVAGVCRYCRAEREFRHDSGDIRDIHLGRRPLDLGRGETFGFSINPAGKGQGWR